MGVLDLFGKGNTDDNIEETEIENQFYESPKETKGKGKDSDIDSSGGKMILLEPRAYSESQQIADHLKKRNSVVVNLKRVTSDQAKRIIDFLSGCIYAIGGTMQKVGVGIYLCAPKNVDVQGKISEDNAKDKDVTKESEEIEW